MSVSLFATKVYIFSKSWDMHRHVDQWEPFCAQSTKTYVCTYVQKHPNLVWWHVNGTDGDCCGFNGRCSIISYGGLWFYSSVWPSTIASSCWTWLRRVGSSSPWSRGTSGDPSMVSNSLPDNKTADWARKRWIIEGETRKKGGNGSTGGKKRVSDTERREMESQKALLVWQTGRMTNTNKYQPPASFHVSTNLFWLLLHFTNKHRRRHLQLQYYGWNLDMSRDLPWHFLQYQSPLDIITVVVTLSAW